uniref:Receptor protein serine/threonine kinase n=1 Tax=Opuntia streptacantha TaxID=393608 RepID=A0A7C9EL40_OPUST
MTGHLLVKSDVYSYGVVLLELLTGRKPVDFSKPPGQENLVAWAHPLLTTNEGLEAIMDPSLKATVPCESFSKVAAIASMCVQPEVSRRPFMGEVVQALQLVCSEFDEEGPKTSFKQEEANADEESKSCQLSGELHEFSDLQYSVLGYESGSDAKTALSATDLVGESEESNDREYQFLKRQCSSGPLRLGMKKKFWQRFRRFSRGSMQERWSGSH